MRRPNIVFILADDLATWGVGCYGNEEIHTPNIDQLASEGTRLTNFFCTSPVCSPARASLLTGKIPSQTGVQDWIRSGNGGERDTRVEYLQGHITLSEILDRNGYDCALTGKWHLGASDTPQKGFKHWFAHPAGGSGYNDVPMFDGTELIQTRGYLTDVITDDAVGFLRNHAEGNDPFYLSVNYTAPHSPWVDQHPAEYVELYADCEFRSCPQEARHPWAMQRMLELDNSTRGAAGRSLPPTVKEHLQGYFASVTALDAGLGRIRATLAELELDEETIVIFSSDNGFNCGHHGIWGKGNATYPANMYDTSIKVPFVAFVPKSTRGAAETDEMTSGYDYLPTILDLVGLADQTPDGLPGQSFAGLLRGETSTAPASDRNVVVFDEYGPTRMIRNERWKYVHRYPNGPHELYDLRHDENEHINLLVDERIVEPGESADGVAEDLRRALESWFATYAAYEFDGRVQGVTGRGQLGSIDDKTASAFHPLETPESLAELRSTLLEMRAHNDN